jgi:DNA-binding CsgD family transcriptional regulator
MRGGHALVPIGLFGMIAALLAADLISDYHYSRHVPLHFVIEIGAGLLALVGVALFVKHAWSLHAAADSIARDLLQQQDEADRWRAEAQGALEGLGAAIERQMEKWGLTEAERDVTLLLLRGLSHKEIADERHTSEGTVRQQALSIYRKAGLGGRSSLAAFFLEGLKLPRRSRSE